MPAQVASPAPFWNTSDFKKCGLSQNTLYCTAATFLQGVSPALPHSRPAVAKRLPCKDTVGGLPAATLLQASLQATAAAQAAPAPCAASWTLRLQTRPQPMSMWAAKPFSADGPGEEASAREGPLMPHHAMV